MSENQQPNGNDLETTARNFEAELKRRQDALAEAEAELKVVNAPYAARQEALSQEWFADAAVRAATEKKEAAQKFLWSSITVEGREKTVFQAAQESREAADAFEASKTLPTDAASFVAYVTAGAQPFCARRLWGVRAREPVPLGSYLLFAANEESGDKFYLVTTQDHAAIAGWLQVTPGSHRGDYNLCRGMVDGKPFLVREYYGGKLSAPSLNVEECPKPLAQLKAKILGVPFSPSKEVA